MVERYPLHHSPLALEAEARPSPRTAGPDAARGIESEVEVETESSALFAGMLQLYGDVRLPDTCFYRVLRGSEHGAGFVAFTGLSWPLYRVRDGRLQENWVVPDKDGWYPIEPRAEHWFPDTLLLEWQPESEGRHLLRVQCADAHKNPIGEVSTRVVRVDNANASVAYLHLSWKFGSEPNSMFDAASRDLLVPCPVIRRGLSTDSVQVLFRARVSSARFRYASIGVSGCGSADFAPVDGPAHHPSHWFTSADDGFVTLQGEFELEAGAPEGAYAFTVYASSRIADDGADRRDPNDRGPISLHVSPTIPVAIVD